MRCHPLVLFTALSAVVFTAESVAQPPDRFDQYRLVTPRSVLVETGGFAGVANRYRLRGGYDFLQQWIGGTPDRPYERVASFDNADIRAPQGELLPAFIDVGALLNLEGLRGELLPLGAPFDVYKFEGQIRDNLATSPSELNSTIELYAALVGPWMYLYGETTPPPGAADFFEYEVRAIARRGRWADWNEDGAIDAADYTAMRDAAASASDFDWVQAEADWRTQFGERAPDMAEVDAVMSFAVSAATAIPEPTALLLVAIALTPALRSRRCGYRL